MKMKLAIVPLLMIFVPLRAQIMVDFEINPEIKKHKISPLIYGKTFNTPYEANNEGYTFVRIGGNRTTAYNWENNASNAGSDWKHQSDDYLCRHFVDTSCQKSASVYTSIIDNALKNSQTPLATMQMCDFVAADKNGPIGEDNPLWRWKKLKAVKGTPFLLAPDTADEYVYTDEFINFLTEKYGKGKIKYALDNEPDLWSHTHPRVFPLKISCKELVRRSVEFSKAIKTVDPQAEIFGFVSYGFNGFRSLQAAPDWDSLKAGYRWFIDYFLEQMKQASDKEGKKLIDVLALHWYPEAKGDNRIVKKESNSLKDKLARLQAPRSLWDSTYTEDSWIAQSFHEYFPLLESVQKSIRQYNPEMKLAFTEFQYGGYEDITGTIALSDVLGIFGKYNVYAANHWGYPGSFGALAYQLYRNFDSNGGTFGDISVMANSKDIENSSVYASLSSSDNSELHIVVMNKNMEKEMESGFEIKGKSKYKKAIIYMVDQKSKSLIKSNDVEVKKNTFKIKLPPHSIFHIVIKK